MAHVITNLCRGTKDTACVAVCPVDAIHPRPEAEDFSEVEQLYINPEECIHCGLCVDECPARAIFAEEDLPPELSDAAAANAAYFDGQ